MKEYKILRQIRFILEGDTVSEEELNKKFTKCAIDDLIEGGFIIKLSAPTGYKIIKGDITFEIIAKNGVEITCEVLDEFSDCIFGKEVSKEKAAGATMPIKDWDGNQSTYPSIARPKEVGTPIPTRDSDFFKKWQEQMFESIGANKEGLTEEEKQALLKRYPTVLEGYFEKDSPVRDCKKEALDILAEGLEANSHFNYYTTAGKVETLMDELGLIPVRGSKYKTACEDNKKEAEIQIPKFEELGNISGWTFNIKNNIIETSILYPTTPENYNVYTTEDIAKAAQVQGKLYQCYFAALKKNCPNWKPDYMVCVPKWGISFVE